VTRPLTDVDIHRLESEKVSRNFGLDFKLLYPWAGMNAPFRGAWCVLRPGDLSEAHSHDQDEIVICMTGHGILLTEGEKIDINAGDVVFLKAGNEHAMTNELTDDFSYYSIWWNQGIATEYLAEEPAE
jgi:mannose-6-phosphate isomerase-like protein (cupin superfamily)